MLERRAEPSEPVEQECRLVIRLCVIGLKLQDVPVDVQGFLNCPLLISMFLIQPPKVHVSSGKPRSKLNCPAEIRFRGGKIVLLRIDNAQEVVDSRFTREP